MFIEKLIFHPRNVRDILESGGVQILVDLMTLAHLHTSRAMIPTQTNVIEASPGMKIEQEKEWYYNLDKKREGPVSFNEVGAVLIFVNFMMSSGIVNIGVGDFQVNFLHIYFHNICM